MNGFLLIWFLYMCFILESSIWRALGTIMMYAILEQKSLHLYFNTNSSMHEKMNEDTCSPTLRAKLKAADGGIAVTAIGSDIMLNAADGNKF